MVDIIYVFATMITLLQQSSAAETNSTNLSQQEQYKLNSMLFIKCLEENGVLQYVQLVEDNTNGIHMIKTVDFSTDDSETDQTFKKLMKCRELYLGRLPLSLSSVNDKDVTSEQRVDNERVYEVLARKEMYDGKRKPSVNNNQVVAKSAYQEYYELFIGWDNRCSLW